MLFYYCCFLCLLAANIFLVFINIFFYVVKAFCFWMLLQKSTKYVSVINILYNLYTSSFFSLVLLIILFWLKQKFEILTPFGIWNIFFCFWNGMILGSFVIYRLLTLAILVFTFSLLRRGRDTYFIWILCLCFALTFVAIKEISLIFVG